MLSKFKQHCAKPITYGAYYKMCAVAFAASAIVGCVMTIATMSEFKSYYKTEDNDGEEEEEAE